MRFQEVLDRRRSIRAYEKKQVSRPILKQLIRGASKAPSAHNSQPWYFYIASGKKRDKIAKVMRRIFLTGDFKKLPPKLRKAAIKLYANLGDCPHLILAYCDKVKNNRENRLLSVAAALENLSLSAVDKGLGTCWFGSVNNYEKQINNIVKKPKNKELVVGMLLGYPKKGCKPAKRKTKKLNQILKFI